MDKRGISRRFSWAGWRLSLFPVISYILVCFAAAIGLSATAGYTFEYKQLVAFCMIEMTLILFLAPLPGIETGMSARRLMPLHLNPGEAGRLLARRMKETSAVTLLFCLIPSLAALSARLIFGGVATTDIARAALVIFSAALCALSIGFCCSFLFKDPVSAAAAAFFIILLVCTEPIWFGPVIDATPDASFLIQPSIMINPIAGLASALDFDIFRAEPFYTICPIGQRRFFYPLWHAAASLFLTVSFLLFWVTVVRIRRMAAPSN